MANNKVSKIEQIIDEIEGYVDTCKSYMLSSDRIIVNKGELIEMLSELRLKTPEEIKKYQKMLNNKEAILNDARERADAMLQETTQHIEELVSEHEIMQQAYKQANDVVDEATNQAQQILDGATNDANNIRTGAIQYTDDCLANIQNILTSGMQELTNRYNQMMQALSTSLDMVNANRAELNGADESDDGEYGDIDVDAVLEDLEEN